MRDEQTQTAPALRWSMARVSALALSLVAIDVILNFLWVWLHLTSNALTISISYALQLILTASAFWLWVVHGKTIPKETWNWKWLPYKETRRLILTYFGLNILIQTVFVLIQYLLSLTLPGFSPQESHVALFGYTPAGIAALSVISVIVAPIVEEVLFRGFFVTTLSRHWGNFWGIVAGSILFAGIHFEFDSFFPLFILGCVMGRLFLKSKSLPTAILFHMFNNLIAMLAELHIFSLFHR